MKIIITESASVFAEKLLLGSLSDYSIWLENKGVDPFKRPLVYEIDHDKQLIHVKQ